MSKVLHGFVPCFSRYRYSDYPIDCVFKQSTYVDRLKKLMNALLDSESQLSLVQELGQEIKPLRPGKSGEMDRVLKKIDFPEGTPVRIDYGNNGFRVVIGLSIDSQKGKVAYIFMISDDHKDFSGKQRR